MVMFKTLFTFALLSALLAIGVSAGHIEFEFDTESKTHRPKDASFACGMFLASTPLPISVLSRC